MQQQQGNQQTSTGASNLEYDLVAEMHELLEGNAALEKYIADAKQAGDSEVERCFQQIHDQNKRSVDTLRQLLAQRLMSSTQQGGATQQKT
jgi:hypothetical protein